jgi:hypothetical protein
MRQYNITSRQIWSEHLIWPWKATIWIRFIKGKLVFQNEKQWELLQKVKMKQIYWRHHALKKTGSSYQYQFSLLQFSCDSNSLLSLYLFSSFHTYNVFQLYVRFSKSSSSSLNKSIKSTPSSSLVMQQLIIYMSISTLNQQKPHILMTWMSQTFLRNERISVKIMALLRSSWCSTCHYIVRILSASISNLCQNIRAEIESNSKNVCRKTIYSRISSNNTICMHISSNTSNSSARKTFVLIVFNIASYWVIWSKQELNNYTVCLWFLKELSRRSRQR